MLREMRKKRGLSQAELARRTGLAQGVISYIETGKTRWPRIDTLQALAAALNCTIEELADTGGQKNGATA